MLGRFRWTARRSFTMPRLAAKPLMGAATTPCLSKRTNMYMSLLLVTLHLILSVRLVRPSGFRAASAASL
jgi:hypothetical protein